MASTADLGRPTSYHNQIPIFARSPTLLQGQTSVPLPGYELWINLIKNVHIVDGILEIDKFALAVARALQLYAHATGRLRRSRAGDWSIQLTNNAIPLEVEHRSTLQSLTADERVIQGNLNSLHNPSPQGVALVNGDAPLLRLKLTVSNRQTAIGISWHHTLGDAAVLLRFMHTVSQFYQGLGSRYPQPTFRKHFFPPAAPDVIQQCLPRMPHLSQTYPLVELGARYAELNKNVVRVDLCIPGRKLEEMRVKANEGLDPGSPRLSRQDCLTAWIVTAFNRALDVPIQTLTNAASYRDVNAPFVQGDLAGNAIYIATCPPWPSERNIDVRGIAQAIRSSIERSRDRGSLEEWMTVASHLMLTAANADESLFFAAPPGTMSINSQLSLDWRSVHFGYPDSARFHTTGATDRCLRVFRANPLVQWDVELCFGVSVDAKDRVTEALEKDLEASNFPDNIFSAEAEKAAAANESPSLSNSPSSPLPSLESTATLAHLRPFMALFHRRKNANANSDSEPKKEKGSWKRPANTAFKQQRLKAWQPILTPRAVLPTLFIIGILFAPIGGLLVWGSSLVTEMTFDYTDCDSLTPRSSVSDAQNNLVNLPHYTYRLRSSQSKAQPTAPQYAFIQNSSNPDLAARNQCIVQFDVLYDLDPSVLLYYKLTNFFQNHRRYVQSFDADQLKGKNRTIDNLKNGNCKPVAILDGKIIYPCGLIANSVFNDTFSNLTLLNVSEGANETYTFSENGIAWPGEVKKYTSSPAYNLDEIVPPPNWVARFPNNYTSDNPPPDLRADEHFQNWMRTAGLPTFTKLFGRNDSDKLLKGRYQITVNMNFPVKSYNGTKSIVITTVSWIGGKNPFLGWAYVAAASLFVALAIAGTIRHLLKPRSAYTTLSAHPSCLTDLDSLCIQ
ncbi:hypothetical protein EW146_g4661 [Bondarzewia mesenterica]|uniref:Uncharacterized protein n=1 Tax=Bondarzewia mesenterica TaxID=1095465 RepID=A0A4S4LZL1_9AGAM|nr:hypothetical protein EW146_g4661 [Bondarzewia mesenterica]